jgi:SAM-dependent methyltransferase
VTANFDYLLDKCQSIHPRGRILDFGCGGGDLVARGKKRGLNIYGVDAFYAGSKAKAVALENDLLGKLVFELDEDGVIPFEEDYFDFVISNQVFEHVVDLELVLAQIDRVLKPSGELLALFPSREVIREGHCGIPMIHWFRKDSAFRYPYMRLMRAFGLGHFKVGKSQRVWALNFIDWLDRFTVYRTRKEIENSFRKTGFVVTHIEDDYVGFRLVRLGLHRLASWARFAFIRQPVRLACWRFAGMVLQATKS